MKPAALRPFKFELEWMHRDGFVDMIKNIWESPAVGRTPIQRWNFKIRAMRQHLSEWAKHTNGIYKQENNDSQPLLMTSTKLQRRASYFNKRLN